jgi:hypothetical protein
MPPDAPITATFMPLAKDLRGVVDSSFIELVPL